MRNLKSTTMSHLCRQVSIESPGPTIKDCVFSFDVPMPDVPPRGARIKRAWTVSVKDKLKNNVTTVEIYVIHKNTYDHACGLVVRVPGYESRCLGFNPRCHLSLLRTNEELLG
uniref:Uncharacterized protein n=1 Tax=Timema douglasi TaxID=61478 RepID=A0A7R8VFK5_TIMDO|nr:unnamed protein product [Timema douglasi]